MVLSIWVYKTTVCERPLERDKTQIGVCVCVMVCVCSREREGEVEQEIINSMCDSNANSVTYAYTQLDRYCKQEQEILLTLSIAVINN